MRRLGTRVVDVVAEHLSTLREQPAFVGLSRTEAERLIASPPPECGTDFDTLIATLRERVFPYAAREPHPGFIAYVPSCPTFPAVLGDWLATGYNFFAGVWPVASGPNEIEVVVLEWFRQWLDMPAGTRGLLTSGGSAANLTAMIAARHELVGEDPTRIPQLTVYMSDQTHSSMIRAAWIAGIPRAHVRIIPTDDAFRLRADLLERELVRDHADGLLPMMVVANGGTTNTGAVDPMREVRELCDRYEAWMHVDAAYGGFSVLTERGAAAMAGIELADSITMDPHKWLYVPFECGCLMAREPSRLKAAFQIFPDYLKDVEVRGEEVNFADYGVQLTRYARALKVWLSVNYFGTSALRDAIDRTMNLAALAERLVRAEETLEVLAPAQLGVLCFRVHPRGIDDPATLDALNERVNTAVNATGRYFISSTRLRGTFSLRLCVLGFRTMEADIEGVVKAVVKASVSESVSQ
ncbi:MAG TPA: aminotransferase class I/II-fold pyridoxal phosphate-dependent enzyme [Gemmatimonadaceae bacterium]|jgi:glutamate/tyrosine decarboxylase-like PLP-dependent enzyme|nr:aminotransferase class I/II-fold pyridoxal phosphate-dependent enzyme [Gemmatimonadaceae bacterium]